MAQKITDFSYYFFKKINGKRTLSSALLLPLLGCGNNSENLSDNTDETSITEVSTPSFGPNSFALRAKETNYGNGDLQDIISATSDTFVNGTVLIDENPYDDDELTISASDDIVDNPLVSGIETIVFTTSTSSLGGDTKFDINLSNITGANLIKFENTNIESNVKTLDLTNVSMPLSIGSHFSNLQIEAQNETDIILSITNDTSIKTTGNSTNLSITANGKSVTLQSSTSTGDVTVNNANVVDLYTISATNDLKIVANGNVALYNGSLLEGNINIVSGGTISITNATAASGTLTLSNERALHGSDIVVGDVNSFGNVYIKSAGAITASTSNGLASAKFISATATENSTIHSDGVSDQIIYLSAENTSGEETQFTLNASLVEELNLAGSSPIVVILDGADISGETVTNINSDATLWLSAADTDLTEIATSIKLRLLNHDGASLIVKDNQDFYLDAEVEQTSSTSVPTFDHQTDATSSTSNAISIKMFDSVTTNSDSIVNVAGLNFVDIQTLNLQLSDTIGINSSSDITGEDLTSVVVTGSGSLNLNNNTITGSNSTRVTLNASNLQGSVNLNLDSTNNGVANIQTGSASDNIIIDGITSDSNGFVIDANGAADTINITTSGDGETAKININGGNGSDTLSLDAGVDLSSSNLTLTSIEKLEITGGGTSQKVAASDVSGSSLEISEAGVGTGILTIVVDQTTVNLSTFTFDNSFAIGTDSVTIDASNAASGVNITGTSGDDTITGSNADDTLSGGDAADTINGGTGDDTIVGGNGADTLSGGAGDDEFDITAGTSTEASMDKINDYQGDIADNHNDTIDNITGLVGADTASIDVKSAISGGSGSEVVTASVASGIATLSGTNAGLIDTLAEWIDAISVDGVIAAAADDADSIGTVAFEFNGNTYVIESNDTFDNNTANVNIVSVIELTGLTSISAVVSDAAAASSIFIA